jgi:hypothetical protein
MLSASRKGVRVSLILGLCAATVLVPAAAQARVFIGVGVPFPPIYAPPPVYYAPPPVYYPPPPAYAPGPAYTPAPSGYYGGYGGYGGDSGYGGDNSSYGGYGSYAGYSGTCYAGAYTCAAPPNATAGSQCTCPGIGAPSYGTVR